MTTKMYLLVDFINPQGNIALSERLDKIEHNLNQIEPLKQNIKQMKATNKNAISCMTVFGRWIIIYQSNLTNDEDTMMHFIDFRVDIEPIDKNKIFSEKAIQGIKTIQRKYLEVFSDNLNTVELSFAEPFEKVLKPNLFICDDNEFVLRKAKELGALPVIEILKEGDRAKVVLLDDKVVIDGKTITNIYALMHFGGHSEEQKNENGFAYLKLFDLLENFENLDDFQKIVEVAGGEFDRAFFINKFNISSLN